jgi:hypothetical protein
MSLYDGARLRIDGGGLLLRFSATRTVELCSELDARWVVLRREPLQHGT